MSTNRSTRSPRRGLLAHAAVGLGVLALLGACTGDGLPEVEAPDVEVPEVEVPEVEAPEVEVPEVEVPEVEVPEVEVPDVEVPADDDGLTTGEWVLLLILGIAVIAIITSATGAATRRSEQKESARTALNDRLSRITGASRWLHDQASVEMLRISDPAQLGTSWSGTRTQIIQLESDITVLVGATGDEHLDQSLGTLGQSVAGLRGSLDALVSLRTGDAAAEQQPLIDDATRTVHERRQELASATAQVQAAQP